MEIVQLLKLTKKYHQLCSLAIRGSGFDIREFKQLEDPSEMLDYVEKTGLEKLGRGSSRIAFILSPRFALKLAFNDAGVEQNKLEYEYSTDRRFDSIIASVVDAHDELLWVISELVRPINGPEEFASLTGTSLPSIREYVTDPEGDEDAWYYFGKNQPIPFIAKKVKQLISDGLLKSGDILAKISSWGKTADGKVVLLDYGLTQNIWKDFYQEEGMKGQVPPQYSFYPVERVVDDPSQIREVPQYRTMVEELLHDIEDPGETYADVPRQEAATAR